jgi:achaete-scute complex protein
MSKVETLRCAVDYIKNLKDMLDLNLLGENAFANFHTEQLLSPTTSSEDPSSPSYASEASSYIASSNTTNNATNNTTNNTTTPAHYDYENYEPVSPEDEELLDCISWWQQS